MQLFGAKVVVGGAYLMCAALSPAMAATTQLTLGGTVSSACAISSASTTVSLGEVSNGKTGSAGAVTLSCNLADTGPTVSFSSANSGLKRQGGSDVIVYAIQWPIAGTSAFNSFSASAGTTVAQLSAVAPGTSRSADLSFSVSAAATSGKSNGTYSDVITISISP